MYAIIINGSVAAVTESFPGPGALFMECGPDAAPGWSVVGGVCVAPPVEPLANLNADIDARIMALEVGQHRATRELLLGADPGVLAEAKVRLAETDALITALRAQRV
jgi:hypothetical protein